jgi:hypothetical protein
MPPLIAALPAIAAIASLAGTGVGLYENLNRPSGGGPTPSQMTQSAVQQATRQRQAEATQANQWLPNLQYQTSGGLSPDAYATYSSTFSGNGDLLNTGMMQQMVQNFMGNTGTSQPGGLV